MNIYILRQEYRYNTLLSKKLVEQLEMATLNGMKIKEKAELYDKLDKLWDRQIELFNKIKDNL